MIWELVDGTHTQKKSLVKFSITLSEILDFLSNTSNPPAYFFVHLIIYTV